MYDARQFYLCCSGTIRDEKSFADLNVKLTLVDRNKVVDIDTLEGFGIADTRMKMLALDKRDFNWNFD